MIEIRAGPETVLFLCKNQKKGELSTWKRLFPPASVPPLHLWSA